MNYQEHPNTLKHHQLITILTEVACVCLIIASIIFGAEWHQDLKEYRQESCDSDISMDGRLEVTTDENGNLQYRPKDEHVLLVTIDKYGNKTYTNSNGEKIEFTTDENGNTISGGREYVSFIFLNSESDENSESEIKFLTLSATLQSITFLVAPFLACVLLMLYVLTLYQKDGMKKLLPWVFRLMAISVVLQLTSFIIDIIYSIPPNLPILDNLLARLLVYGPLFGIQFFPLAVLAKRIRKEQIKRKAVIATLVVNLLWFSLSLLYMFDTYHTEFEIVANILYIVGYLSFTAAWFILAYWYGRHTAVADNVSDLSPVESPSENLTETPAEAPAPAESVEE